jgi:hypothetical protein
MGVFSGARYPSWTTAACGCFSGDGHSGRPRLWNANVGVVGGIGEDLTKEPPWGAALLLSAARVGGYHDGCDGPGVTGLVDDVATTRGFLKGPVPSTTSGRVPPRFATELVVPVFVGVSMAELGRCAP